MRPTDRGHEEVAHPRGAERPVHPAAARLIEEIRATGEFTDQTWERLSRAMDDLSDADLSRVLEEIGHTARKRPGG